jgi:DNA repair exonuclease SbcCD nuclease subunit
MADYLLETDFHLSDKAPSSCTETYLDDLLELLRQSTVVAKGFDVRAVAIAGDVFHNKTPGRTSHRIVQLLIDILREYDVPVGIVPGNHDMRNDRFDSLTETQPFGVLLRAGAAQLLDGWWHPYGDGDAIADLYGVPWQQDWSKENVWQALAGYRSGMQPALVVTHAPLYPPGKELPWENFPAQDFAAAMSNKGWCFYGHVHEPHGTWTCDGVTFCNNGALSRGSLHEYNLERKVGVTIWRTDPPGFTFVPLKARPKEEVFRLREKEEATDMAGRLDEFLADVGTTTLSVLSIETVIERIKAMKPGDDVVALAEELLTGAHHGVDGG